MLNHHYHRLHQELFALKLPSPLSYSLCLYRPCFVLNWNVQAELTPLKTEIQPQCGENEDNENANQF